MATITTTAQTAPASATAFGGFARTLGNLANGLAAYLGTPGSDQSAACDERS